VVLVIFFYGIFIIFYGCACGFFTANHACRAIVSAPVFYQKLVLATDGRSNSHSDVFVCNYFSPVFACFFWFFILGLSLWFNFNLFVAPIFFCCSFVTTFIIVKHRIKRDYCCGTNVIPVASGCELPIFVFTVDFGSPGFSEEAHHTAWLKNWLGIFADYPPFLLLALALFPSTFYVCRFFRICVWPGKGKKG
jgi:hypothetical protein